MDLKTGVANGEAPATDEDDVAAASYDAMVSAAERHARAIVREAEEEACRILEDAVRVAFRAQPPAPRPPRWAVFTLLLAGCAVAASLALVVGIAVGQM
jgi:hypothetical protein